MIQRGSQIELSTATSFDSLKKVYPSRQYENPRLRYESSWISLEASVSRSEKRENEIKMIDVSRQWYDLCMYLKKWNSSNQIGSRDAGAPKISS